METTGCSVENNHTRDDYFYFYTCAGVTLLVMTFIVCIGLVISGSSHFRAGVCKEVCPAFGGNITFLYQEDGNCYYRGLYGQDLASLPLDVDYMCDLKTVFLISVPLYLLMLLSIFMTIVSLRLSIHYSTNDRGIQREPEAHDEIEQEMVDSVAHSKLLYETCQHSLIAVLLIACFPITIPAITVLIVIMLLLIGCRFCCQMILPYLSILDQENVELLEIDPDADPIEEIH